MKNWGVGAVILLLFLQSCAFQPYKNASPTFREAFFADEEAIADFLTKGMPQPSRSLNEGWIFLSKDSLPGISRSFSTDVQGESIQLPHRITFANHSFWYHKTLDLEEGILALDADDGVQLWIDGKQIKRMEAGDFFQVDAKKEASVTIRVVNNAMAGGLQKVGWMSTQEYWTWKNQRSAKRTEALQLRKKQLLTIDQQQQPVSSASLENELTQLPMLMTSPVLVLGSDQSYFLRWVSEKAGEARLRFSQGKEVRLNSATGIFTLPISGDVEFELWQEKAYQGKFTFSLPRWGKKIKLAIWADSQGGWKRFDRFTKLIHENQVDLSIGAGDLVNNGSEEDAYPRFLQKLSQMNAAQLLVPGNHDYDGYYDDLNPEQLQQYLFRENEPRYGFQQVGPVGVLTLDPSENFPVSIAETSEQGKFLHSVLNSESWNSLSWKMVVLHQPPYSQGWPGYHGEESIRALLEPYFHAGKIDLVIAGHTHDYERLTKEFSGNQVHFFIVGGAGGGMEPEGKRSDYPIMDRLIKKHHVAIAEVTASEFAVRILGSNGELLDELTLKKKGSEK
jgi:Icc-related predicted phosphoesterase